MVPVPATTVDIPDQLARLTEGDPLLVHLYVQDLLQQGEAAARLRPEDLAGLKPGFGPYFKRWLEDEERSWHESKLAIDRPTVDTILALLACALGSLQHADLEVGGEAADCLAPHLRDDRGRLAVNRGQPDASEQLTLFEALVKASTCQPTGPSRAPDRPPRRG